MVQIFDVIFVHMSCSQATAVLTSKHFAQKQPWLHYVAVTPRSTAAVSNWSWTSPLLSWDLVTSSRPWGQSCQHPREPWHPQVELCPQPSGPSWPLLSLWCSKLCSESSPMPSFLTGTTCIVRIWEYFYRLFYLPHLFVYLGNFITDFLCSSSLPKWFM